MRTFYEWLLREEEAPSNLVVLKQTLRINPSALIGTTINYSGQLNGKDYPTVGLTVVGFDDPDKPSRVKLQIIGDTPNMPDQTTFVSDKDDVKTKTSPDDGVVDMSLEDFEKALGQGWGPALAAGGMGGAAPGGPPMGGM
jgi:hypothetical protein